MAALKHTRIFCTRTEPISRLRKFEKRHDIPTSVTTRSMQWIQELCNPEIDEQLEALFASLRKSFGLKRRQLDVQGPAEGRGVIETPFFNVEVSAEQDPDSPELVVWTKELNCIRNPEQITSPEFENCFDPARWSIEVQLSDALDIETLIDRVEDDEIPDATVEYDKSVEWCEIRLPQQQTTLRATSTSFLLTLPRASTPGTLLKSLFEFQMALSSHLGNLNLQESPSQ